MSCQIFNKHKVIVGAYFICYLILGTSIFGDYGFSWDEDISRSNGLTSFNYVFHDDNALLTYVDRDYGVAFELPLTILEKILHLSDSREIFLMRHLITFLLFYISVIFFYLLCRRHFKSWKVGLLGATLLILSPRIFADSFYNSKDIPCLSFFIISAYTLVRYMETKSASRAIWHALSCGILIDIRVAGLIMPLITYAFVSIDVSRLGVRRECGLRMVKSIIAYTICLGIFVILFWPWLWKNPLNIIDAVKNMSVFRWEGTVLYLGKYLNAKKLPWHYAPVWIMITTPLIYNICFFAGVFRMLEHLIKVKTNYFACSRNELIFLLWLFAPLVSAIVLKSVLIDGWRHLYFVYPAFLMFVISGMLYGYETSGRFKGSIQKATRLAFVIVLCISLSSTMMFMVRNHPYQNVFFNSLAGDNLGHRFELDYWGLSYRKALEAILKEDSRDLIKIKVANDPGILNSKMIRAEDRRRLVYVEEPEAADYFLSNYRWHPKEYPYANKFYSVKVDGSKIMVVYKMKAQ